MYTISQYLVTPPTMTLDLPKEAKVLTIQVQDGEPQMVVLLNTLHPTEWRKFVVYSTGEEVAPPHALTYCGTYQLSNNQPAFHVFEYHLSRLVEA